MRTEIMSATDVELLSSDTLTVWIRRPDIYHRNWWLCFHSTSRNEAWVWNDAIETVAKHLVMAPFHQGIWPDLRHHCGALSHDSCENTTHAWELWMGCSEYALAFPTDSIEDIRACGDEALERVYAGFEEIRAYAENRTR